MSAREEPRAKFDRLRARYLVARGKYFAALGELEAKYGPRFARSWAKPAEQRLLIRLSESEEKVGDALFEHIRACSPRDWAHGVPADWVRGELSWEDVVRPLSEPLSVVPPLSWGSTVHKV